METKNSVSDLKSKLFLNKTNIANVISYEEYQKSEHFSEKYKKFLNISKTEREFVINTIKLAKKMGFSEFDSTKKYVPGDKVYIINRAKAIALCVIGKNYSKKGIKLCISHVDSPRMDLKPNPLYEICDLALFKTHYYGGIKKYQWTSIPLSMHGKIIKRDGTEIDICYGENENEPCFCITDLLPHLADSQMKKAMKDAISGESLNILIGSIPFKSDKNWETKLVKLNTLKILNDKYGIVERDFLSAEIEFVPAFKARDIGFDRSMIGAYGQDDKCCAYAGLSAILECKIPDKTIITYLCDKEETGSDGNTGMKSEFLKALVKDIAEIDGVKYTDVMRQSECLSADVNACYDPTFAENFEINNSCQLNNGVVVTKYTGSRGKSSTSDASAEYMEKITSLFDKNSIIWQTGELGKVDNGGGGTIAQFIANLNVNTIDIGIPVLSMHSPFEVISKLDLFMTYKSIYTFYNSI